MCMKTDDDRVFEHTTVSRVYQKSRESSFILRVIERHVGLRPVSTFEQNITRWTEIHFCCSC